MPLRTACCLLADLLVKRNGHRYHRNTHGVTNAISPPINPKNMDSKLLLSLCVFVPQSVSGLFS